MNSETTTDPNMHAARSGTRLGPIVFAITIAVALAVICGILFVDMPKVFVGVLVIVLTILLLLTGIPVGIAMLGSALTGLWTLSGTRVVESTMRSAYEKGFEVYTLTDAVGATSVEEHANAITYDYPMFSKPITTAEYVAALSGDEATTDASRGY